MTYSSEQRKAYCARLEGTISEAFHGKTILTVGVGAGSYAVEKLARLCPRRLKNCDFDRVEIPNLCRTTYTQADADQGKYKVDALKNRIESVNPLVDVQSFRKSITEMDKEELDQLISDVDLIVAGTDDFEAQALLNEIAIAANIPAVFVGIHAGAQGGRVIWVVPGETPCYRCLARERYEAAARDEGEDLNLSGAQGCLIDTQFIDMVATKVAVAILEREQDSQLGQFYEKMRTRNDIVVRCDPAYEWGGLMWDAILGDLPSQPKDFGQELKEEAFFSMDSIWLRGQYDPECPVCQTANAGIE